MDNIKPFFKNSSAETLFLIFALGGYVIASGLAIPLHIENSRLFAVPYRLVVFSFSLLFIWKSIKINSFWSLPAIATVLFWLLYLIKVIYSFHYDNYLPEVSGSLKEIVIRIITIALVPVLALISIDYKNVELKKVATALFWILIIMLLLNLLYGVFNIKDGKLAHIFSIYYISYGHLGTSLAIVSFYLLEFTEITKKQKIVYVFGLILGFTIIVEGFARSPFLALMTSFSYLIYLTRKKNYYIFFGIFILVILSYIYFSVKFGFNNLLFVDRTYNWIFLGDNSLRTPLFERAIQIFQESPFLGGRVLYEDGMYPHNIFLELLMATGFVGLILYFIKFIPAFLSWRIFFRKGFKDNGVFLMFALFIQYFTLVLTSYSLFSTPEFLHLSGIIIGLSLNNK